MKMELQFGDVLKLTEDPKNPFRVMVLKQHRGGSYLCICLVADNTSAWKGHSWGIVGFVHSLYPIGMEKVETQ